MAADSNNKNLNNTAQDIETKPSLVSKLWKSFTDFKSKTFTDHAVHNSSCCGIICEDQPIEKNIRYRVLDDFTVRAKNIQNIFTQQIFSKIFKFKPLWYLIIFPLDLVYRTLAFSILRTKKLPGRLHEADKDGNVKPVQNAELKNIVYSTTDDRTKEAATKWHLNYISTNLIVAFSAFGLRQLFGKSMLWDVTAGAVWGFFLQGYDGCVNQYDLYNTHGKTAYAVGAFNGIVCCLLQSLVSTGLGFYMPSIPALVTSSFLVAPVISALMCEFERVVKVGVDKFEERNENHNKLFDNKNLPQNSRFNLENTQGNNLKAQTV